MLFRDPPRNGGKVCIAVLSVCALAMLPDMTQQACAAPALDAARLPQAPILDGEVSDDDTWTDVVPVVDFHQVQPRAGEPASERTEVYVGFTDEAMYIGVIAHADPKALVISDSRRDASLDDTDAFLVIIDGLRDRQNGFVFGTNAAGIEYDGQVTKEGAGDMSSTGGAFNLNWDATWRVASRRIPQGWSAEFEIPFRSLRYGNDPVQDWGINFQRNIRHKNEVAYWSPLERNRNLYRVSEAGTLRGIEPPVQRNLKFTPYALGRWQRGGTLDGTATDSDAGFDVKYSITPSLTLDLTWNTDFAQVEADEQQINLDRFNLFFPEKRPFFLENAGLFTVGNGQQAEMFFSRRIGIADSGEPIPVAGGARVSGKVGESTNIGLLYMRTEAVAGLAPANDFAVARISQELPNRSSVGAIVVSRDGDGSYLVSRERDYNRTYAIDGRWGIGDNILLESWVARTETPGLDGNDDAFAVKFDYSAPEWAVQAEYSEVGENFNPEVGFLSRTNYRKAAAFLMRVIRPDDLWGLLEIRPHVSYRSYWKPDGFQESGLLHLDTHWEAKSGAELHTGYNFTLEGVVDPFEIVPGVTVPSGTYEHGDLQLVFFSDQSRPFSYGINAVVGGRFGGDRVHVEPYVNYRIGERFRSEFSFSFNDYDLPVADGEFTANLARARLSYSFTPKLQLAALVQYGSTFDRLGTNIRFSWLRSANSGLYVVYNEVDERGPGRLPAGREFVIKYSHIFDVFN
jgi:hypothetical protein